MVRLHFRTKFHIPSAKENICTAPSLFYILQEDRFCVVYFSKFRYLTAFQDPNLFHCYLTRSLMHHLLTLMIK